MAAVQFPPTLLTQAQGVRVMFFDVDGVLTDGRIYLGPDGEAFKAFATLDGHGLKMLATAGVTVVVITGRDSLAVRRRVADLGLARAHYGVHDKLDKAQAVLNELQLDWTQAGAMGDDWPDLPLMTRAGLAVAPPQAHPEVLAVAHHVTRALAGHGAARECCDVLLQATGHYTRLLQAQQRTLDGV